MPIFSPPPLSPLQRLKYQIVAFGRDNGREEMLIADKIFRCVKELKEC
jgi:hypothetical protein